MNTLALFAKNPEAGKVKTRLGKILGMENAKHLYEAFLKDLIIQHKEQPYHFTIFSNSLNLFPLKDLGGGGTLLKQQEGNNLGDKMQHAFRTLLKTSKKVVIIGSDMPHLTPKIVNEAFNSLEDHDIVLGPTEDGGYYLIGMKKDHDVFTGIPWSTKEVLQKSLKKIEDNHLTHHLLEKGFDVDVIDDMHKLDEVIDENRNKHTSLELKNVMVMKTS